MNNHQPKFNLEIYRLGCYLPHGPFAELTRNDNVTIRFHINQKPQIFQGDPTNPSNKSENQSLMSELLEQTKPFAKPIRELLQKIRDERLAEEELRKIIQS